MFGVQFNAGPSRKAIREAIELLDDMTPVYTDIGEYMIEATRKRFARGVGPDGRAWAPKRAATLERYKRLGYGSLGRPLIGPGKALSRQIHKLVSRDGVVIGSSLAYSGVMQDGAAKGAFGRDGRGRPIPWGRIPARVWLGLSADDDAAIVGIVDEHLEAKFGETS
jgi:phage gpG-like protein